MPDPTGDERWTQIRYDYEHTERPIADICAEHGISPNTLRDRVRRWRWTKRRAPIPREGPPAMMAPQREMTPALPQHDSAAPSPWPLGPRLRGDERGEVAEPGWGDLHARTDHPTPTVFAAAQTVDPPPPGEGNEAQVDPASIAPRLQSAVARMLPAIEAIIARLGAQPLRPREMEQTARALGALTRTLRELNALLSQHPAPAAVDDDPVPEDMDAFRNELARRIRAFIAARRGEKAAAEDTAPADH